MKNIFTCLLILAAFQAQAQQEGLEVIPKGTKFIGGTLSMNFNDASTDIPDSDGSSNKTTSFGIGPVVGKYIRDNVAIGLGAGYNFSGNKNEYSDGSKNESRYNSADVFAFVRKNYKIAPNIFFFLEAYTGFEYGTSRTETTIFGDYKMNRYTASIGGSPGFQVFLAKKFSLEASLGNVGYRFSHINSEDSDVTEDIHNIGFNGGLGAVNFSVTYFIFQ